MARLVRYLAIVVAVVAAFCVWGHPQPASAQVVPPEVATPPTAPEAAPQKIEEINDAVELFRRQDFEGALSLLEKAVKKHSELPPAQIIMADLFARAKVPAMARQSLDRATMDAPDDPEAFVVLGNMALQERRVTEADLLLTKAMGLLKTFDKNEKRKHQMEAQTISGLALVAQIRKQWPAAETLLESLTKLEPKDVNVMQRMAAVLFQQKKAAASYEKLKEAYNADKEHVLTPEARLGDFYEQYGDHPNAVTWMNKALKKAPDNLQTQLFVANWAVETSQFDEAQTHAAKALQLDPKSLPAQVLRGVVALFQKDYKSAERYFEDAHLQSPGTFEATNNLALALCEQNDKAKKQKAQEYAQANWEQYQRQRGAEAASTLGWVRFRNDDLEGAEQALQQAVQLGALNSATGPETAYYIAQVYYVRGRKEQAKNLVDAALKSTRPFFLRPEALELQQKLKAEPKPSTTKP